MFSYAGIICAIHVRRKRSVDRSVKRLEFMVAVWREDEDSHAILLHYSITCMDKCKLCFLVTEILVSLWKVLHVP